MGIFAKGSQFPADVVVDTPQNRYGGQFTKDSAAGDALGGVISDVNSKAESANTTAGEIIADIEELEGRVAAIEGGPGPDLSGYATNESVDTKVSNAFGPLDGRVDALENASLSPEVVVYGTFSSGSRQTVLIESAAPLPPGYSITSGNLYVPAGTYMYELLHTWTFSGEWSYQSGGSVVVDTERVKVVKFTTSGFFYLRGITTAGNMAVVRVTRMA